MRVTTRAIRGELAGSRGRAIEVGEVRAPPVDTVLAPGPPAGGPRAGLDGRGGFCPRCESILDGLLTTVVRAGPGAQPVRDALESLAPWVRRHAGAELIDVLCADPAAARLAGCTRPRGAEQAVLRAWRHRAGPAPVDQGGLLLVPAVVGGRLVAALRVRPLGGPEPTAPAVRDQVLAAVATLAAVQVVQAVATGELARAHEALMLAGERSRIVAEVHARVRRQLASGLEQLARADTAGPADRREVLARGVEPVRRGYTELRVTALGLAALPVDGESLAEVLRAFARRWQARTGVVVRVRCEAPAQAWAPGAPAAALRLLFEHLSWLAPAGRADVVVAGFTATPPGVVARIEDNGAALEQRMRADPGLYEHLRALQERLREVAACPRFVASSTGLVVEASFPRVRPTARAPSPPTAGARRRVPAGRDTTATRAYTF